MLNLIFSITLDEMKLAWNKRLTISFVSGLFLSFDEGCGYKMFGLHVKN